MMPTSTDLPPESVEAFCGETAALSRCFFALKLQTVNFGGEKGISLPAAGVFSDRKILWLGGREGGRKSPYRSPRVKA